MALNFNEVFNKAYDEGSLTKCVYICLEHNAILNEIENVFIRFFLFFNNHAILKKKYASHSFRFSGSNMVIVLPQNVWNGETGI